MLMMGQGRDGYILVMFQITIQEHFKGFFIIVR